MNIVNKYNIGGENIEEKLYISIGNFDYIYSIKRYIMIHDEVAVLSYNKYVNVNKIYDNDSAIYIPTNYMIFNRVYNDGDIYDGSNISALDLLIISTYDFECKIYADIINDIPIYVVLKHYKSNYENYVHGKLYDNFDNTSSYSRELLNMMTEEINVFREGEIDNTIIKSFVLNYKSDIVVGKWMEIINKL